MIPLPQIGQISVGTAWRDELFTLRGATVTSSGCTDRSSSRVKRKSQIELHDESQSARRALLIAAARRQPGSVSAAVIYVPAVVDIVADIDFDRSEDSQRRRTRKREG
jgi:hypothetical protein